MIADTVLVHRQQPDKIISLVMKKRIDIVIGQNLRRLRVRSKMSQERLAVKMNIESVGLVSDWERGVKGIGKDTLERLCEILKAGYYEFYIEKDTPILQDPHELSVIKTMRSVPNASAHIGVVAEALSDQYSAKETHQHKSNSPEKKKRLKIKQPA